MRRMVFFESRLFSGRGKKEETMPTIQVSMFEGRTMEQKRKLVAALTEAVVNSLGSKPESVHIILHDLPRHNIAVAGVLASDKKD